MIICYHVRMFLVIMVPSLVVGTLVVM